MRWKSKIKDGEFYQIKKDSLKNDILKFKNKNLILIIIIWFNKILIKIELRISKLEDWPIGCIYKTYSYWNMDHKKKSNMFKMKVFGRQKKGDRNNTKWKMAEKFQKLIRDFKSYIQEFLQTPTKINTKGTIPRETQQ